MIRIGGSVGGRFSRPIKGTTSYENRILQNNEHSYFWQDSKFCIDNGIYLIVNIDTYMTNSRWRPSNQELRDFVLDTKTDLKAMGANKSNCRFTCDNESNEYCKFDYYMNMVRVIHDALDGQFDLGAGNFHTTRIDLYGMLVNEGGFEVLDMHFQDRMGNTSDINYWAAKFPAYPRRAVTEGNNFWNVSTLSGHNLLKHQINVAEQMGCEDFCFPFVNWTVNNEEGDGRMSYCLNDNAVSPYWDDMLNVIKTKKPVEVFDMYGIEINYVKPGCKNEETRAVQQIMLDEGYDLSPYGADGIYGAVTKQAIEKWQTDNGLKVDGWVGKETWQWILGNTSTGMTRFLQYLARTARYR
jgi:hypothetical protein